MKRLLIFHLFSIPFVASVSLRLLGLHNFSMAEMALIGILLYITTGLAFFGIFLRFWRLPDLKEHFHHTALWGIFSLVFGLILVLCIPINPIFPKIQARLEITALGTSDPKAGGSDVLISAVVIEDAGLLHLADFTISDGYWIERGETLIFNSNVPGSLTWNGLNSSGLSIDFITCNTCGLVQVSWFGEPQSINTYSEQNGVDTLVLPYPMTTESYAVTSIMSVSDVLLFANILFYGGLFFLKKKPGSEEVGARKISTVKWLVCALLIFTFLLVYHLAFWPAIMSFDSTSQWYEAVKGQFTDYHPAFSTILLYLITWIYRSPAAVILLQTTSLSIIAGYGFAFLEARGTRWWLVLLLAALFGISPVNGLWSVTLWKDIPYSILVLLLTFIVVLIFESDGLWIKTRINFALLTIVTTLGVLFRHNGPIAFWGSLAVIMIVYRAQWKTFSAVLLISVALWAFVRGPIYQALDVKGLQGLNREKYNLAPVIHLLAGHVHRGTPLTDKDQLFLRGLHPADLSWDFYRCYNYESVFIEDNINWTGLPAQSGRLYQLALELSLRSPLNTLVHFACKSETVWRVTQFRKEIYMIAAVGALPEQYIYPRTDIPVPTSNPKLTTMNKLLTRFYHLTLKDPLFSILWRPASALFLQLIAFTIFLLKNRPLRSFVILTPILLHTLGIVLAAGAPDLRYQYPVYLTSWFLVLYFFKERSNQHTLLESKA